MRANRHQAGVMLIEALIGILIFSIGILALLGMQGAAMKNAANAKSAARRRCSRRRSSGRCGSTSAARQLQDHRRPRRVSGADNWVTAVAGTLPGGIAPQIQVGPDPVLGLADREVRVTVQWHQPGDVQTDVVRQFVILNRIHEGSGISSALVLHKRVAGMSLVELMVAMLIGLIGIVIITHLYITNDRYKRSTTGTGEAQVNGAIALYTIEREIRGRATASTSRRRSIANSRALTAARCSSPTRGIRLSRRRRPPWAR